MINHVVQPGENLWTIAARYGVSVQVIAQANGLTDPNLIYVGSVLQIPVGPYPQPNPRPNPGGGLEQRVSSLENRMDRLEARVRRLED